MVYSPWLSDDPPKKVPSNIMLQPINGSPVLSSIIFPVSFPVVPLKMNENKEKVISNVLIMNFILYSQNERFDDCTIDNNTRIR